MPENNESKLSVAKEVFRGIRTLMQLRGRSLEVAEMIEKLRLEVLAIKVDDDASDLQAL